MPATAKTSESTPDELELYRLRDDLAQAHNPANAHERMLVTQIAQSWLRLQRAQDLERQYFHGRDLREIIATKLDEFKAVTRYVTDCERAWRHALLNLEQSKRQRQRTDLSSPNMRRGRHEAASTAGGAPAPTPAPAPPATAPAHQPRE